jgi:hypothetical protein
MSQSHPERSLGHAYRHIPDATILHEDACRNRSPNSFSLREKGRKNFR